MYLLCHWALPATLHSKNYDAYLVGEETKAQEATTCLSSCDWGLLGSYLSTPDSGHSPHTLPTAAKLNIIQYYQSLKHIHSLSFSQDPLSESHPPHLLPNCYESFRSRLNVMSLSVHAKVRDPSQALFGCSLTAPSWLFVKWC